jgi:FtsP/CotA-like multicopper oxidase with cupredoxin domain
MPILRRSVLKLAALAPAAPLGAWAAGDAMQGDSMHGNAAEPTAAVEKADVTLRIATGLVELAPDQVVSTTLYNDQFPGPLLRFTEGQRVVVDIHNDTDTPELVHWHGQTIPTDVDGAAEEGSPFVPAHGMQRIVFEPKPAGFRFAHSHVRAGADLARGPYTGQVAPVYIEPKINAGAYDREVFLVLKEFNPTLSTQGDMSADFLAGDMIRELMAIGAASDAKNQGWPRGYEVGYGLFSINGKMLGHGEPVRVRQGERVLFHVLNGSATEIRSLALPGHVFRVVALDGNPVPVQAEVPVLWLGTAERISAIVAMKHPGVWVLGDLGDDDRGHGMGIVIEYAGRTGKPQWVKPKPFLWDYTRFGNPAATSATPDETIEMLFVMRNAAAHGFNLWTINGEAFSMDSMTPMFKLQQGRRYRLKFRNGSDDIHPLHLHRHSFELTRVAGKPTAGIIKDVVILGGFQELEVDFVADNPGRTLFHCHQQIHMDFGFMALFDYV